jgi:hypothetical protein
MEKDSLEISAVVSVTPSHPTRSYWDSLAALYKERVAIAQKYTDMVAEFQKKIASDLEGYWTARRAVTGDDLAVRLEMAGHLIQRLAARIDELEANQYDPYDR